MILSINDFINTSILSFWKVAAEIFFFLFFLQIYDKQINCLIYEHIFEWK